MVAKEYPEVIEGRRQLIGVDVLDSEEAAEDSYINHDDADMDEEDGSGLVGAGVTEEVGDMQNSFKSSSLSSYILKPPQLLTQVFGNNRTAHEKLFKHMCNFGSREDWRKGRRVVSSYLDVETTKNQCRILDRMPLDCIAGYIMDDAVGERPLKRLHQRRLNFIDSYISCYYSILNSPELLEQIRKANKLVSVLCYLEYDIMRGK